MCIFITVSFRGTLCKVTTEKKVKSKAQNHMEDKISSDETLRKQKQKLVHPLLSSNCPVDSHISNMRWSSCSRKNRIPGDDTWIRKAFTSFATERPVLALPQHVTLKPKWYWEELHKHGHVVNPAGACYHDVTTCFFRQCFACQDYKFFTIFSLQALIIPAFCWYNSILCYLTLTEHHLSMSLQQ